MSETTEPNQEPSSVPDGRRWSERTLRRLAQVAFAALLALYVVCIVWALADQGIAGSSSLDTVVLPTVMFSFAIAGFLVAGRRPRNPLGWILLEIGATWTLSGLLEEYGRVALLRDPSLPWGAAAIAVSSTMWVLAIAPMGTFLLLLFPDGHLPSPRWRWLGWTSGAAIGLGFVLTLVQPGPLVDSGFPHVSNPFGIGSLGGVFDVLSAFVIVIPACIVACAVALVMRYRRSTGVERFQLKWVAAAAGAVAFVYAGTMIATAGVGWGSPHEPAWASTLQVVALGSFALIPAGIAVAILRYRLYDIDRIISRALSYALLTAVLGAVYAAIVVGIGAVAGGTNDPVLIAGATLAVAALFGPARRRIQALLDRRFYRRRYDLERTLATFTAGLRDQVDLEQVRDRLVATVRQTLAPDAAFVWMRAGPPPRLASPPGGAPE